MRSSSDNKNKPFVRQAIQVQVTVQADWMTWTEMGILTHEGWAQVSEGVPRIVLVQVTVLG